MKNLIQMRNLVDRYLQNLADAIANWDAEIIEQTLREAYSSLLHDLLAHNSGRTCLRRYTAATALVAGQEVYALPADCMRVDTVEIRWRDTDTRWYPVAYSAPPAGAALISGNALLFGTSASASGGIGWFDDTNPAEFRIWPARRTVTEEKYRLRYYRRCAFPVATGTLRDPAATGVDTEEIPEGADTACCYLAVALLGGEELNDGKKLNTFSQLYSAKLRELINGPAQSRTRPTRRYIGRAN